MSQYASVILDSALDKPLEYSIPPEFTLHAKPGVRVEVPLRRQFQKGYILKVQSQATFPSVKPIAKILSDGELITPPLFELALWLAKYYCTPLHQVFKILLPSSVRKDIQHKQQFYVLRKKTREELKIYCEKIRKRFPAQAEVIDIMLQVKKGILLSELLEISKCSRSSIDTLINKNYLQMDIVRIDRSPLIDEEYFKTKAKQLNAEQSQAFEKVKHSLSKNQFETHLIFGVTGSGKTEIYLQAIEQALMQNKGTIMLVPEISLTAQTIERFRSRFDHKIAILHHQLSQGERFDEWHKIRRGESSIVIGARSAIFSPVPNLGLIIVDEEHEQSYKQSEEQPCYNARDVAVMRGKMSNSTVILGSATPSLESYYNASISKYTLSKLTTRAATANMPRMHIVDMAKEFEKAKGYTNFSEKLIGGIKQRFEQGEQTILFLNRRGYHTTLLCQQCRQAVKCEHCDVTMTFHLGDNALACHLCGYTLTPPPKQCPNCHHDHPMKYKGVGTELIEKNLHALFPGIRTVRMDADTTKHKGSHQKLLKTFSSGKADVLIGTQMIAKGLHFPSVTLVGILNCDSTLNLPDFRASETVFQLITQVSGRAGRGQIAGEVILQTSLPDNSTISLAAANDYEKFFEEELNARQAFNYPPFSNLIKITFSGPDQKKAFDYAHYTRSWLMDHSNEICKWHEIIPAGYAKVKGHYRYQFLICCTNVYALNRVLENFRHTHPSLQAVKMRVDVNPISTFF
ncbi:Primosomal protein N' [Neochlamydia sp. AcF65]|uniref:primosomal protein N' n=1 Tax=Neochlamydia sp. AcF65 TaxID=2795735 RepID=UPI001BCA645C|nr:primosomal protein N' [Neochlamydia sp. AcF65]MBS4166696.1 Primosomal protein N' [Neochlamydia sp. AcF65]